MQTAKLQRYRERLLEARRRLVRETDRIRETIPEEVHPPGEHEIAPSEGIDIEMSLEAGDEERLHEIDAALERIKAGTFARCCLCGAEIPAARLDAIPSARYCIACETTRDREA